MKQKTKFKQTEIGKIPVDWEVIELKNLCEITSSKRIFRANYVDQGVPFYRSKEIIEKAQGKKISTEFFITEERFNKINKKYGAPQKNDILISAVGARSGIPYYVVDEELFYFKDGNLIWFRKFKSKLYSNYLFYFLKSYIGQNKLRNSMIGSAQPALTIDGLKNLLIELPLVEEQQSIAKILSDLDDKIELNQQMNKTLEAIGQAIFKHWFVDFEFPNEKGKQYKSSGGKMIDSELGEIPEGWSVRKLGALVENFDSKRIPLSSRERDNRKGKYPYYGATSIMDYIDEFLFNGIYVLMGEDGTVIDKSGRPVLQYVWSKFWVNNHAHILKGKLISTEMLHLLLSLTNVEHIVTGAVQPKIKQTNMNNLDIILPPDELLKQVEYIIQKIYSKYRIHTNEIKNLSQIRDALLPKLMSGQIRVPVKVKK